MPTVLRKDGFEVRIRLPPREHPPPHVHVHKAGGMLIVNLPDGDRPLVVREIDHMRDGDVTAAIHLVQAHAEHLIVMWRRYHGLSQTD